MNVQFRRLFAILFCRREPVVAIFQVELNEEVVKEFEAERFFHNKEGVIIFQDANSETIGIAAIGYTANLGSHREQKHNS
jgi:hypothetical protein